MNDLERLHKATKPFADLVNKSSGRIPIERLSLADWHSLVKAYNDCNIPPELLCEDEGCDHHGIDHVCVNSSATADQLRELCALLEKAEEALKAQVEDKRDGPFFHEDEHPKGSCLRNSEEALAAIKQWKKQT